MSSVRDRISMFEKGLNEKEQVEIQRKSDHPVQVNRALFQKYIDKAIEKSPEQKSVIPPTFDITGYVAPVTEGKKPETKREMNSPILQPQTKRSVTQNSPKIDKVEPLIVPQEPFMEKKSTLIVPQEPVVIQEPKIYKVEPLIEQEPVVIQEPKIDKVEALIVPQEPVVEKESDPVPVFEPVVEPKEETPAVVVTEKEEQTISKPRVVLNEGSINVIEQTGGATETILFSGSADSLGNDEPMTPKQAMESMILTTNVFAAEIPVDSVAPMAEEVLGVVKEMNAEAIVNDGGIDHSVTLDKPLFPKPPLFTE